MKAAVIGSGNVGVAVFGEPLWLPEIIELPMTEEKQSIDASADVVAAVTERFSEKGLI